jgi:hypothetical protein
MANPCTFAVGQYYDELAHSLPRPASDTPDHRRRRLATAIEALQALHAGNDHEARLAVQIVLCGAHAVECLREAGVHWEDFGERSRCRAQANDLMREENAARRLLVREQELRLATGAAAPVVRPAAERLAVPDVPTHRSTATATC